MQALSGTQFNFSPEQEFYKGKVRDVYYVNDKIIVVASDRISAFDHILPRAIPYKGQILNQIAFHFLDASSEIVPNWLEASPDPNVSIGKKAYPIKLEMVIRGYLAGHAWREYKAGKRILCGVPPATKAEEGHDEDISAEEILKRGIVSEDDWELLSEYTRNLFDLGTHMAKEQGLILVDTKYEFGMHDGEIILIDEIHTPDSSRYYILEGYEERQSQGEKQKQLSKEFVRMPEMPDEFVAMITDRYEDLYTRITGRELVKGDYDDIEKRIEENVRQFLAIDN